MKVTKPEPLRFPKGVRFARRNELPRGSDEALLRIASANVTTGFVRRESDSSEFKSYFEANIHVDEIFDVFECLSRRLMPDFAAPMIGLKEEEPEFGPFTSMDAAIEVLRPFKEILTNDGFLEFGLILEHQGHLEEVFVKSSKYFQIWTNHPAEVEEVFAKFRIPPFPRLEFIDEYPMVSKSMKANGEAAWPEVVETIRSHFAKLPVNLPEQL